MLFTSCTQRSIPDKPLINWLLSKSLTSLLVIRHFKSHSKHCQSFGQIHYLWHVALATIWSQRILYHKPSIKQERSCYPVSGYCPEKIHKSNCAFTLFGRGWGSREYFFLVFVYECLDNIYIHHHEGNTWRDNQEKRLSYKGHSNKYLVQSCCCHRQLNKPDLTRSHLGRFDCLRPAGCVGARTTRCWSELEPSSATCASPPGHWSRALRPPTQPMLGKSRAETQPPRSCNTTSCLTYSLGTTQLGTGNVVSLTLIPFFLIPRWSKGLCQWYCVALEVWLLAPKVLLEDPWLMMTIHPPIQSNPIQSRKASEWTTKASGGTEKDLQWTYMN